MDHVPNHLDSDTGHRAISIPGLSQRAELENHGMIYCKSQKAKDHGSSCTVLFALSSGFVTSGLGSITSTIPCLPSALPLISTSSSWNPSSSPLVWLSLSLFSPSEGVTPWSSLWRDRRLRVSFCSGSGAGFSVSDQPPRGLFGLSTS